MRTMIAIAAGTVALVATPVLAKDRTGYQAIAAGDLVTAEQTLTAERRIYPRQPELMLNLAAVYERTGRTSEARALYTEVLSTRPVSMEMPNGSALSSHIVAAQGLKITGSDRIVSR